MAEVTISIKGRYYDIACDDGQEGRVIKLAAYIDEKMQAVSRSASAYNEAHLMILTSLLLTDELFEARDSAVSATATSSQQPISNNIENEKEVMIKIQKITKRIEGLNARVKKSEVA